MSSVPFSDREINTFAGDPVPSLVIDLGRPAPLIVVVNQETIEIDPHNLLRGIPDVNTCRDQWRSAPDSVFYDLCHLLEWSPEARWAVFLFIVELGLPYRVRSGPDAQPTTDLLEVVLGMMVGHDQTQRCENGRRAAVEVAALLYADCLPVACNRIRARLQELDLRGYRVGRLIAEASQMVHVRQATGEPPASAPRNVREVFAECPVPDEVVVPPWWTLNATGLQRAGNHGDQVTLWTPLVITRRLSDVVTGTECLGLAWYRDGIWQEQVVKRTVLATSRSIVELAEYGLPITSNNAVDVVQYLHDFEAANAQELPQSHVTSQMGWQGEAGRGGFLWGQTLLHGTLEHQPGLGGVLQPINQGHLVFRGRDNGDNQLVAGYHSRGTFEGWCHAIRPLGNFPRARLTVYGALCAPLLEVLNASNFIFSYAGPTSSGKTTALRAGASCAGCPDEQEPSAALSTWDSSRVWIERAATVLTGHPLILDDTKRTRNVADVAQTIYDVATGRGRGRGSVDGLREVGTFCTVLLTSGEASITSFSQDGGTRARVLEIWGSPFCQTLDGISRTSEEIGRMLNELNEELLEHYGHALPLFVQFLIDRRHDWPGWRAHFRRLRQRFHRRAGTNAVAGRMAEHFAALRMTALLAHLAGIVPWGYRDVISASWGDLTDGTAEADRAAVALRYIWSWAESHREEFHGQRDASAPAPSQGWAGRWDRMVQPLCHTEGILCFFPHKLESLLEAAGFEPGAIRRMWAGRNWLRTLPGRSTYRVRMPDNQLAYLVAIEASAIRQAFGETEPGDQPPRAPRGIGGLPPEREQREQSENTLTSRIPGSYRVEV
jgi:putative DNA primase/helicase